MKIGVLATDEQWEELISSPGKEKLARVFSLDEAADAYLLLDGFDNGAFLKIQKPLLLNSVIETLKVLKAGTNVVRINGWPGFLQRKTWEAAGNVDETMKAVFSILGKEYKVVADEPGLVAARSISMIINEAYFALGEKVSTKEEIDIAMKLGTNYPLGPFEWADKIGLKNIYALLALLSQTGKRYLPAPLLEKETAA